MRFLERIARAAAALLAGMAIAAEHLRDAPQAEPVVEVPVAHCPECGGSLLAGPHFHNDRAYWACEDHAAVLVTDDHGAALR